VIRERQELQLVELIQHRHDAAPRRLPFLHDLFPFHPKWADTPDRSGQEVGYGFLSQPSFNTLSLRGALAPKQSPRFYYPWDCRAPKSRGSQ
jgi:hypothetical protein